MCTINAMGSSLSTEFLSIGEFYELQGKAVDCGKHGGGEGGFVRVFGYIDCSNVFDRRRYPHLPYEKFMMRDENGKTLEVWVRSNDGKQIFDSIYDHCRSGKNRIYVRGKVVGFDMPIMGKCLRGYRIDLEYACDLFFE